MAVPRYPRRPCGEQLQHDDPAGPDPDAAVRRRTDPVLELSRRARSLFEDFASREIPAIYYLSTSNPIDLGIAQLFHNHAYRIDPNNSFGMFTVTKFVKVH